uniref:SAM domain-containing protein n=1 Tax=Amphimedon queenslandica TaxID=400682 RepID=A0A1X7TFR4_AMPQE
MRKSSPSTVAAVFEYLLGMDGVNSSEDLAEYLKNKLNLPERFCQAFIDNYIDGSEFLLLTREDISQFIEPVGIVKKIIRHIEELKCVE